MMKRHHSFVIKTGSNLSTGVFLLDGALRKATALSDHPVKSAQREVIRTKTPKPEYILRGDFYWSFVLIMIKSNEFESSEDSKSGEDRLVKPPYSYIGKQLTSQI